MPQTVYDVGSPVTSTLDIGVTPDGTTAVTLVVYRPDGVAIATPAISGWGGTGGTQRTAQWYFTDDGGSTGTTAAAVGDWVVVWHVAGTGAGVKAKVFNVRALVAANDNRPTWAPFLSDVADYVPRLTIDTITAGSTVEMGTFNGRTSPTDEQAQRLLDSAVYAIVAELGAVAPAVEPLAARVATQRAAAAILRAYSRSPDDLTVAAALDAGASADFLRLLATNSADDPTGTLTAVLPVWSFPTKPRWADYNL